MQLTRFGAALRHHKAEIDDATFWRYVNGHIPKLLRFIAERPQLAAALAEDAAELAKQRDDLVVAGDGKGGDA